MHRAFTLLELLLVIGILSGVAFISIPSYRHYQVRQDLHLAAEQITQALGRAQLLSQSGKHEMPWGYAVEENVIFAGDTYAMRDPAYDEFYPMSPTIQKAGLLEVTFSRLEGRPSATGTILLTSIHNETRHVSIRVDRQGIAVDVDDKFMICHCKSTPPHTLTVPDSAWSAHKKHGDYFGPCRVPETKCKD